MATLFRPSWRLALHARWRALVRRWVTPVRWAWVDWFDDGPPAKQNKLKAYLDVTRLEIRRLPSFAASLYAGPVPDPYQQTEVSVGRTTAGLLDGNAQLTIPVAVGRVGTQPPAALVYNSDTVNVKPIVAVQVSSGGGDPVPSSIVATLTFNGSADSPVTFTCTGHSAGDTYLLALPHATQITSSGYYAWSVSITVNYTGGPTNLSVNGNSAVVVRDTSSDALGRGWGMSMLDSVVDDGNGILYIAGTGAARYFTKSGSNYISPANDFGTMVKNVNGTYKYTAYDQTVYNFDTGGKLSTIVDPHTLTTTFSYTSGRLSTIQTPDLSITTFTYDGSNLLQTVVQPGPVTLTMAHASASDLTSVNLPNGGTRTFTYDGSHKLTVEAWADQTTTMAYDGKGMLSSVNRGGNTTNITPVLSPGLATTPAVNTSAGVGVVTDPLSHSTTFTLDTLGRTTKMVAADGGVSQWALNSAGLPTKYTDPLNRVTSYTYAANTADVTKVELPDGGVISMTYDSTYHKVTVLTDQLNHTNTFTYDAGNGDLLTSKDALNNTTTYTWSAGLLQTITDPLGRTTTFIYTNRQLTTEVDALGNRTTYTYDAAGHMLTRSVPFVPGDPEGGLTYPPVTTFTYDTTGNLIQQQDALGYVTTFVLDALNRVIDTTVPNTARTTYAYDSIGRLVGETDAVGASEQRRLSYGYDAADRLISSTDGLSHTTSFGFDVVNRRTTVTDALNHTTTTSYDLAGQVTAVTDALNHTTSYGYDLVGRTTTVTDALNHTTTTAYDLAGNVRSVTDPLGVTTSYAYDAVNRRTQVIEDKGGGLERTSTITYDAVGNVLTTVDPLGHTTSYAYDGLNRQISKTDPLGHVTSITYLVDTRQVGTWQDALGYAVTATYDRNNRLISETQPDGGQVVYGYDAVGNLTLRQDELGHFTYYGYDKLNRLVTTKDDLNHVTTFVYDAADNRTVVIDPDGNRSTFAFDAANRSITQTDPLNHSSTFAYDAANRLTSITDGIGQRRDFTYNEVNQKLTESWYSATALYLQTQTFTYDARGAMLTAQDPDGTYTFTYDDLGRTATAKEPFGLTLTYTYDAADNRTVVQDSKGGLETFAYDAGNRETSVKFTGTGATISYGIDWTNRDQVAGVTRYSDATLSNKIGTTSYTYDSVGRLTHEQHKDGGGTNIENTTLTYDVHGRLTEKKVDGTSTTYTYDTTDQLTQAGTATFGYDANGNRTNTGYTTGTGNQTTNDGTWTYTYDSNGNRTKRSKGAALETWTYGYDQRNELIWVEKRATDGGTLQQRVEFAYDALGQRIQRTVDTDGNGTVDETERYGLDNGNMWAVLDANNNLGSRRLFGVGVDDPVARIKADGTVAWYLTDYQHSVTVMVDGSGTVQDRITYDGFGNVVTQTNAPFWDGIGYTGRQWDAAVQLQYNRARYYDPTIGKWVGMDPIGFDAGDANLYRYVGNEPINGSDPSGQSFWGAVVGYLTSGLPGAVVGAIKGMPSGFEVGGTYTIIGNSKPSPIAPPPGSVPPGTFPMGLAITVNLQVLKLSDGWSGFLNIGELTYVGFPPTKGPPPPNFTGPNPGDWGVHAGPVFPIGNPSSADLKGYTINGAGAVVVPAPDIKGIGTYFGGAIPGPGRGAPPVGTVTTGTVVGSPVFQAGVGLGWNFQLFGPPPPPPRPPAGPEGG